MREYAKFKKSTTNRMKEVHGEGFAPPWRLCAALEAALDTPPDLRRVC